MAGGESRRAVSGEISSTTSESDLKLIDDELRENGIKSDISGSKGHAILNLIGFEMVVGAKVARGRFVVNERSTQPFGVLHGGTTAHIAESIASEAATIASNGKRVAGIEMNVNHLRAALPGQEVIVIAKALMQGSRIQVWEVKFEAQDLNSSTSNTTDGTCKKHLIALAHITLIVGLPLTGPPKGGLIGMSKM